MLNPKYSKIERIQKSKDWFQAHPWLKHFYNTHYRVHKHESYKHLQCSLTKEEVKIAYLRDDAGNMVRPSIDRIDTEKGYYFENIRFVELRYNQRRPKRKRIRNE